MASYNVYFNRTKRKITPLIFVTMFSFIVNLYILIMMIISGLSISYILFPIISLTITGLFLAYQLLANLKLKYARKILTLYIIISLLLPILYFVLEYVIYSAVIVTDILLICYTSTCALTIIFTILSTRRNILYSLKANIFVSTISFLIFLAVVVANIYFVSSYGVFGQGKDNMAVVYVRLTDGTLRASSLVNDNNKNVVINDTFNGKKVSEIDTVLLNNENIESVTINMDYDDFSFINADLFNNPNLKIIVDSDDVNNYKKNLYNSKNERIILLSNSIVPEVEDDEAYVSFSYTKDSLEAINYNYIPTLICEKGSNINLADCANYDYVKHSNKESNYDLDWNYSNNNGYIINAKNNFVANDNLKIDINFEKIYKIEIENDNDNIYEAPDSYKKMDINGNKVDYLLVTNDKLESIINDFPKREGYKINWNYKSPVDSNYSNIDNDYNDYIKEKGYFYFKLKPEWEIEAPTVDESFESGFNITYGDNLTFDVIAEAKSSDHNLKYIVYDSKNNKLFESNNSNVLISKLKPLNSGDYTLKIETTSIHSSLKNELTYNFKVSIDKKLIDFNWISNSNNTFDGNNKNISVNYNSSDVAYDDTIAYNIKLGSSSAKSYSLIDAGSYGFILSLEDDTDDLYKLNDNDINFSYTINKKVISSNWDNTEFEYDGTSQYPVANIEFAQNDNNKPTINYTKESSKDVGSYEISVSLSNYTNYVLSNGSLNYKITPRNLNVTFDNDTYTYDGTAIHPSITSYTGDIAGDTIKFDYTLDNNNAGNRTVKAICDNSNYKIVNDTKSFTIQKRNITIIANPISVTYGENPTLTYVKSEDLIPGNEITGNLSCLANNVGTYDINIGSLSCGDNYKINYVKASLTINKKNITITAKSHNVNYGDNEEELTYTLSDNLCYSDKISGTLAREEGQDIGSYNITIGTLKINDNYDIEFVGAIYKINPKNVSIVWSNNNLTYDGTNQFTKISAYYLDIENNKVDLSIDNEVMINAGNYTLKANFQNGETNYKINTNTKNYAINQATNTITKDLIINDYTYGSSMQASLGTTAFGTPAYGYYYDNNCLNPIDDISSLDAGTYYVKLTVDGTDNYTGISKIYSFNVLKVDVTVNWTEISFDYDGLDHFNEISAYYYDLNNDKIYLNINEIEMIEPKEYDLIINNNIKNYNLLNNTKTYQIREV